jgi:hypothetical protein
MRNSQPISLQALGTSNNEAATDGRSRALKSLASALRIVGVRPLHPSRRRPAPPPNSGSFGEAKISGCEP